MKTLFPAMLFIATCFLTTLTSCTEDAVLPASNTTVNKDVISYRSDTKLNRHYFDNGNPNGTSGVDFGCVTPPVSCFDDVVVVGQKLNVVNDIFSNISSWSAAQLQDYVDENSADMSDIIGSSETNGIISGSYTLRTRGNASMATRYLVTKSGSTIVSVTPIDN